MQLANQDALQGSQCHHPRWFRDHHSSVHHVRVGNSWRRNQMVTRVPKQGHFESFLMSSNESVAFERGCMALHWPSADRVPQGAIGRTWSFCSQEVMAQPKREVFLNMEAPFFFGLFSMSFMDAAKKTTADIGAGTSRAESRQPTVVKRPMEISRRFVGSGA